MSSADALKLENQLCFPLYACSRQIIKLYKPHLDVLGITYTQYITLLALWEHDVLTVKQLGDLLYLDSGTLTPLLKKLETQKLITRVRSEADERSVVIELTEAGRQMKIEALDIPNKMASCLNINHEDAMTLHKLLHGLLNEESPRD